MCLYVFPVVGLTLPFISYGGTSIVTMFAAMGIISVSKCAPFRAGCRDRAVFEPVDGAVRFGWPQPYILLDLAKTTDDFQTRR